MNNKQLRIFRLMCWCLFVDSFAYWYGGDRMALAALSGAVISLCLIEMNTKD